MVRCILVESKSFLAIPRSRFPNIFQARPEAVPKPKAMRRRVLKSGPMHPAIPRLLELQRLDQIIASLRAELDGLPKQLREADAKLNGARAAVAAAKEA